MIQTEFYCKIRFWLPQVFIVWDTLIHLQYLLYGMYNRKMETKSSEGYFSLSTRVLVRSQQETLQSTAQIYQLGTEVNTELNNNTRLIMNN